MHAHRLGIFAVLLAVSSCTPLENEFRSQFAGSPDRTWIGPDYFANRLLDWELKDGRLTTDEGRQAKPMRTVHLLSKYLSGEEGTFTMAVRTGSVSGKTQSDEHTWTGFLLGAGGPDIDFRISVLVHHWSSRGGGLFVGMDGTGRIILRDNENPNSKNGSRSDYTTSDWPEIIASTEEEGRALIRDVRLILIAVPSAAVTGAASAAGGYTLDVSAVNPETGERLARAVFHNIPAHYLSGTVALVSHRSPDVDRSGTLSGADPEGFDYASHETPGYWFQDWEMSGSKLVDSPERTFGPVMGVQYTLSDNILKMTAQLGPIGSDDTQKATLELFTDNRWEPVGSSPIHPNGFTSSFRVEGWSDDRGRVRYRVGYDLLEGGSTIPYYYEGIIRSVPANPSEFVLGALNCQNVSGGDGSWTHNHIWYPHAETSSAVEWHDPDMLFFAGDQIYEGGIGGIVRAPTDEAILDYMYHWYRFVWAFGDLMRDRPTVTIPDDHDVYHGNIWGEGGKAAVGDYSPSSDNGGYIMAPDFVNAVHRTQTSHLPDAFDPSPILQDISVYYTDMTYGGISFGIVADRMFKTAPRSRIPDAEVWNGWPQNPSFDAAKEADSEDFVLLGKRQLDFLDSWAQEWKNDTWMKVVLSQTVFNNVATIPEGETSGASIPSLPLPQAGEVVKGDKLAADMDSGGWPSTGRDRALTIMRRARAFHVVGDQHLGSVVQYGIENWNDAGYGFVVPSIANIWPRRWFPPIEGANRVAGSSWYTGEFTDGFGNKMTVHAAANPEHAGIEPAALNDRVPGYGIIRIRRESRDISFEAWPRWVDPSAPGARPFRDWPISFNQLDNDGREVVGFVELDGPVAAGSLVSIYYETGEHVYTHRLTSEVSKLDVYESGVTYLVTVRTPDGTVSGQAGLIVRLAD
ncbi:MAG: hypothetical protein E2O84_05280 [Bacteroidetes bacterium]|nr:MAG: hypothetical protein E2O84_05280 [Bacteroidota bacterium]